MDSISVLILIYHTCIYHMNSCVHYVHSAASTVWVTCLRQRRSNSSGNRRSPLPACARILRAEKRWTWPGSSKISRFRRTWKNFFYVFLMFFHVCFMFLLNVFRFIHIDLDFFGNCLEEIASEFADWIFDLRKPRLHWLRCQGRTPWSYHVHGWFSKITPASDPKQCVGGQQQKILYVSLRQPPNTRRRDKSQENCLQDICLCLLYTSYLKILCRSHVSDLCRSVHQWGAATRSTSSDSCLNIFVSQAPLQDPCLWIHVSASMCISGSSARSMLPDS